MLRKLTLLVERSQAASPQMPGDVKTEYLAKGANMAQQRMM